jgi:tRNA U34 5-methylaminomethyl-2-thiouridine-forming methyltransferase MnmC
LLNKINKDFITLNLADSYNLIYFDAFAPDDQPEMWTIDVFKKLFNATKVGGILVTYCSKGIVKRTLREVGYKVERLAGPPGKRHMIRATKL